MRAAATTAMQLAPSPPRPSPSSGTIAPVAGSIRLSALAPRTRYLATTIHALGAGPLHELFCDLIVVSSTTLPLLEQYAALAAYADLIEAYGGCELSPNMRLIK